MPLAAPSPATIGPGTVEKPGKVRRFDPLAFGAIVALTDGPFAIICKGLPGV
jgi:hypothetical protein